MTVDMLGGHTDGAKAVGLLSSGGTESILLAVLTYREQGRAKGIEEPEILAGISAHPALTKACHYFGVTLTKLPLCPITLKLLPETVEKALSRNTVAVYASAPTFTHGIVDPIEDLGTLAEKRGVGLHVDNCLGGFLLSYLSKAGVFTRPWDFRVKGVTTISCDLHKCVPFYAFRLMDNGRVRKTVSIREHVRVGSWSRYGHTSKGVSVIAFRTAELRRMSYVPSVDGCEGLYVTPTLQGSRAGGTIAQAWATVCISGELSISFSRRSLESITLKQRRMRVSVDVSRAGAVCW